MCLSLAPVSQLKGSGERQELLQEHAQVRLPDLLHAGWCLLLWCVTGMR